MSEFGPEYSPPMEIPPPEPMAAPPEVPAAVPPENFKEPPSQEPTVEVWPGPSALEKFTENVRSSELIQQFLRRYGDVAAIVDSRDPEALAAPSEIKPAEASATTPEVPEESPPVSDATEAERLKVKSQNVAEAAVPHETDITSEAESLAEMTGTPDQPRDVEAEMAVASDGANEPAEAVEPEITAPEYVEPATELGNKQPTESLAAEVPQAAAATDGKKFISDSLIADGVESEAASDAWQLAESNESAGLANNKPATTEAAQESLQETSRPEDGLASETASAAVSDYPEKTAESPHNEDFFKEPPGAFKRPAESPEKPSWDLGRSWPFAEPSSTPEHEPAAPEQPANEAASEQPAAKTQEAANESYHQAAAEQQAERATEMPKPHQAPAAARPVTLSPAEHLARLPLETPTERAVKGVIDLATAALITPIAAVMQRTIARDIREVRKPFGLAPGLYEVKVSNGQSASYLKVRAWSVKGAQQRVAYDPLTWLRAAYKLT